ncbi:MAG: DMT family transporter, partial [Pseudomonadota bacterium]
MIAVIGTILPNTASYQAMDHLPSGLMSVLLSLVPMVAFPVALALGNDQFSVTRVLGLMLGLGGVLLIVVPDAALPPGAAVAWVIVALVAPICYAFEGNLVAKFGLAGMDPVQALFGASVLGAVLAAPLAVGTGQFITPFQPYGLPEFAIIGSSVIHAAVYSMYVWMVGRAGPTFAVQVSYLVTGFGVMWAMVLLGERFSIFIWAALALMFAGIFLVQPKQSETEPARLQGADG